MTKKSQASTSSHSTTRSSKKTPRVALVIDWLDQIGGAEQVLLALHEMYPDAPIYTSVYRPKKVASILGDADVRTGWLNIFPIALRRFLGPLRQTWFSHLNLNGYDLVISVTGAEAKGIKTDGFHLCYCHVPTQYYWQLYDDYLKNPGFGILNPLARLGLKIFVKPMRKRDFKAAKRPDKIVTISTYAADQIKKYYHRDAEIINPPVDLAKFEVGNDTLKTGVLTKFSTGRASLSTKEGNITEKSQEKLKNNHEKSQTDSAQSKTIKLDKSQINDPTLAADLANGFITTSRQVVWKRLDLCIKACIETGMPLTLIGEGPEHDSLVRLAKNSNRIHFIPRMPQAELSTFLRSAKGYLFPSKEPFGLAPVEALAVGCPVIALGQGGALDYIEPGKNGLLFEKQTAKSLAAAIRDFDKLRLSPDVVKASAARFDKSVFIEKIEKVVEENLHAK